MAKKGVRIKNNVDWDKVLEAEHRAKAKALWMQGQAVIAQADKDKLVPIETATLRRSSVVTLERLPNPDVVHEEAKKLKGERKVRSDDPKSATGDVKKAWVSYNTPYAEYLHENTNWEPRDWRRTAGGKIAPSPKEGGPKWLEKALASVKDKLAEIAVRVMKEEFK